MQEGFSDVLHHNFSLIQFSFEMIYSGACCLMYGKENLKFYNENQWKMDFT